MDNLTVTLLKRSVNYKQREDVDLHMKSAAENYLKLNAISLAS